MKVEAGNWGCWRRSYHMRMKNGMELEIQRVSVDDAEAIIAFLNQVGGESDHLLFGENGFHMSVEQERRFLATMNGSSTSVMLIGWINGSIASIGSLSGNSRERIAHRGEIGLSVKKEFWNCGIGTEMMKALIQFGKETAHLTVLELKVKSDNEQAIHVYEKLGFRKIGIFEKYVRIDGIYYDSFLMNLYL